MSTNILDSLGAHIAVLDNNGVIVYTNKAWDGFYKKNKTGLTGEKSGIGVNYLEHCLKASKTNKVALQSYEGIRSVMNGDTDHFNSTYSADENKWYRINVIPIEKEEGVIIVHRNITEKVSAEREVITEKLKFEALFSETTVGMVILDETFHFLQANKSFCDFIGYSMKELKKFTPLDITVKDDLDKSKNMLNNMARDKKRKQRIEKQYIRKDGKIVWGEVINKQIKLPGGDVIYYATIVDISDRKKDELEIQTTKQELTNIIDYADIGIIYTNSKKEVISVNKKFLKILEYAKEKDILGKTVMSFTHPDDIEKDLNEVSRIERNEVDTFDLEKRYITQKNNVVWVSLNVSTIRDKDTGKVSNFIGMVKDITEQKESQRVLQETKSRLELATESANMGLWDWNITDNILVWDDSMYKLYEVEKSDFTGAYDAWQKTLYKDDVDDATQAVNDALCGKADFEPTFRIVTKRGKIKYIHARAKVIFDEENKPVRMTGINMDVTEKELMELEKHRAIIKTEEAERQRISHDLHDGLGQTIAAANMCINTLNDYVQDQLDEDTLSIFNTGRKLINDATKETRSVSHNIMPRSLEQFGLEQTVEEMVSHYQKISEKVLIKLKSNLNDLRFAKEKELSLFRVLQESINNAIKHSRASRINVILANEDEFLTIKVNDNGVGFKLDEMNNGKNPGIGLISLSQRIKMIGGKLDIKTKPTKGTKITISLRTENGVEA